MTLALIISLTVVALSIVIDGVAYWTIRRFDRPEIVASHPTGREVAERVLQALGATGVRVVGGDVDSYRQADRAVQLVDDRLDRASVSASAIAAHEAAHAAQHARGWSWFRLSAALTIVSIVTGPIAFVLFLVDWVLGLGWPTTVGALLAVPVVLAAVATAIVEVSAARQARATLRTLDVNQKGVRRVLTACSATYVTEAVFDLGYFTRRTKELT
ncbi:MAG: zinc metallopeptidase, partial [Solirubrobacteraceae bacterium]|nr:zinc metallopeptidase [Solirubrobacteraceae bacterium]